MAAGALLVIWLFKQSTAHRVEPEYVAPKMYFFTCRPGEAHEWLNPANRSSSHCSSARMTRKRQVKSLLPNYYIARMKPRECSLALSARRTTIRHPLFRCGRCHAIPRVRDKAVCLIDSTPGLCCTDQRICHFQSRQSSRQADTKLSVFRCRQSTRWPRR